MLTYVSLYQGRLKALSTGGLKVSCVEYENMLPKEHFEFQPI